MKRLFTVFLLASISWFSLFGQQSTISLTFSGKNNSNWFRIDTIRVMNRTTGADTVLYYPDTTLTVNYPLGIGDINGSDDGFALFQNYPNPVTDMTNLTLYLSSKDRVSLMITDAAGRQVLRQDIVLDKGYHNFRFVPGSSGYYLLTATLHHTTRSIKIVQASHPADRPCSLEWTGPGSVQKMEKITSAGTGFVYNPGNKLQFIAFAGSYPSGTYDSPSGNKNYVFEFNPGIPCPGLPTVTYEGQMYHTVQIGSQCWMKENMNVGTKIDSNSYLLNNSVVEKYCYNDDDWNCYVFGGLYTYGEATQYELYDTIIQGICPPGWHIPTDYEWKVVEGNIDSQHGVGDWTWDQSGYDTERGSDVGKNMKGLSYWLGYGADNVGFTAMPSGNYDYIFQRYGGLPSTTAFWTGTPAGGNAWFRLLSYYSGDIRYYDSMQWGLSVRCIKD